MDFSEIYKRYARDVYVFSLYLSGNSAVAEDLTSETFVRAFCGRADLHVNTLKAYLFASARNLHRDSVERQRRLIPISDAPEGADPAPSPDRAAQDRETFSAVLKAIQGLPEIQREALVLSMNEDLRYEQIAAILGCSVTAVKVRIHRARLQLRSALAEDKTWKNITRNVIADLWPAYVSGDASPDTRALVEAFLREDSDFAQALREAGEESFGHLQTPPLTPDHELRTLAQLKHRLTGPRWLLLIALGCTAFAFGRLISDTSFDVSPRRFIASAVVAASLWTAFLLRLFKGRREVLIRITR